MRGLGIPDVAGGKQRHMASKPRDFRPEEVRGEAELAAAVGGLLSVMLASGLGRAASALAPTQGKQLPAAWAEQPAAWGSAAAAQPAAWGSAVAAERHR